MKAEQRQDLLGLYRRMLVIRGFEERAARLYRDGEIPGFVHLCIGQEATAVGACSALGADDVVTSTHRGHGHCLARGLQPGEMFAELMARDSGTCHGLGGSMHIADARRGVFGANGIVGAGLPIATGAGLAQQLRHGRGVVVAFFGDGAQATGAFHESLNLASLWRLPIIFFCENNHYAEFSAEAAQHTGTLAARAAGYAVEHIALAGNDVVEVARAMRDVVASLRERPRAVLVEADTYRWHGHYEGDPQRYRSEEEVQEWKEKDPLLVASARLAELGATGEELDALAAEVAAELDAALAEARAGGPPGPGRPASAVVAPRRRTLDPRPPEPEAEPFRTMDAVRTALEHELEHDPDVFVAGIDVGEGGNVFGLTRGLWARWPERVLDTPIAETALMGAAVGAALAGLRPVVELMYIDFLGVCFDQILNQMAKIRFMTGGEIELPITIRTQFGAGRSSGSQHSQSLEAIFAHIPGLTVLMPSDPAETYGLLRAAIRDPNPVVFIENRLLYGQKGPKPGADYVLPIGKARIVRPGTDVTVVSYSRMVWEAVAAAEELATEGVSVEVVDLRTIAPLDRATVLESVRKTSRLVIAHEAVTDFGVGAEIAALMAGEGFWLLDAPVERVGAPGTPAPYAPNLEQAWLPDRSDIRAATMRALRS
jgi:2-oxoisovalerate dehydrogenase E1 component